MVRGLFFSIVSACCFGMLPILGKLGHQYGLQTTEMLQYRFGLGALLLAAWFAVADRGVLRIRPRSLAKAAFVGALLYPVQSSCFIKALETIPASTTSLIFYLHPAMVTLIGAALHRERIGRHAALALALVSGGCTLVFLDAFTREANPTGVGWAVGAMSMFSCYLLVVQAMLRGERPLTFSLYVVFFAALAFTAVRGMPDFGTLTREQVAVAAAFGVVPTALAVTTLYVAIEAVGSAWASIFSSLEPVATLSVAALLLGEALHAGQLVGAVCIVAGILVPNLHLLRRRRAVVPDPDQ